jgi:hypothetical protein
MPWAPLRPRPVTLICISTSQAGKGTEALLHTAPLWFLKDGTSRTSSRPGMASVEQGNSGPSMRPHCTFISHLCDSLAIAGAPRGDHVKTCH